MTYKGLVIALGTILVAVPPAAAQVPGTNAQAKAAVGAGEGATKKEKKYCLKEANTGTRLASVDCRTKAEWAREGVDIEAVAKGR